MWIEKAVGCHVNIRSPLDKGGLQGGLVLGIARENPLPQKARGSFLKASIPLSKGGRISDC